MKNLKKILSLSLALSMTAGLFATTAFAKDADSYTDAGNIKNKEAVSVLSGLGVIAGKGDGSSFDPTGNVTRAEMAKLITSVVLNVDVDVTAFNSVDTQLTDLGLEEWAIPYMKYCYSEGYISGRGDGRFDPKASVTTAEAARMLLGAIGYKADVQGYTGSAWKVNVIRDAQQSEFFTNLSVPADKALTRDEAAQLVYNAIQSPLIVKSSSQDRVDGSINDVYTKVYNRSLLSETFRGKVWTGTFEGNYNNGAANSNGYIAISGQMTAGAADQLGKVLDGFDYSKQTARKATFPYALDISNIAEEYKVVFKDGAQGTLNQPDDKDTIYGVFKTGSTKVVNATRNDVKDLNITNSKGEKILGNKDRISVGNETYDVIPYGRYADTYKDEKGNTLYCGTDGKYYEETVVNGNKVGNFPSNVTQKYIYTGTHVIKNYTSTDGTFYQTNDYDTSKDKSSINRNSALTDALAAPSGDTLKLVFNSNNEVERIYAVDYTLTTVVAINNGKISLRGAGKSFDIAANDVYSGVAVNDVVTYTTWYNEKDLTAKEALTTVRKADSVAGTVNSFSDDKNNNGVNVTLSNTTYPIHRKLLMPEDVANGVNNGTTHFGKNHLGTEHTLYLVNGFVGAAVQTSSNNYCLVIDVSANASVGAGLNGLKITVLESDGTVKTLVVSRNSTMADGKTEIKSSSDIHIGDIVKYTGSAENANVKIQGVTEEATGNTYNRDKKQFGGRAVTSDAPLFRCTDAALYTGTTPNTLSASNRYVVSKLWDAKSFGETNAPIPAKYVLNSDKEIVAMFVGQDVGLSVTASDVVIGLITAGPTTYQGADGIDYSRYTVSVTPDQSYEFNLKEADKREYTTVVGNTNTETITDADGKSAVVQKPLAVGDLIGFAPSSDNLYDKTSKIVLLSGVEPYKTVTAQQVNIGGTNYYVQVGYADSYNATDKLFDYYTGIEKSGDLWKGTNKLRHGVSANVKLFGFDIDGDTVSSVSTVSKFNTSDGYANVIVLWESKDTEDQLLTHIAVETSNESNIHTQN